MRLFSFQSSCYKLLIWLLFIDNVSQSQGLSTIGPNSISYVTAEDSLDKGLLVNPIEEGPKWSLETISTTYAAMVALARQEAKCLLSHGGQQLKINPLRRAETEDLYEPFTCVKSSIVFTQCEQCRNLTGRLRTREECQTYCGAQTSCVEECVIINQAVFKELSYLLSSEEFVEVNESEEIEETTSPTFPDWDFENVSEEVAKKVTEKLLLLSKQHRNKFAKNTVDRNIDSVKVFCEGVIHNESNSLPSSPERYSPRQKTEAEHRNHFVLLKWSMKSGAHSNNESNMSSASGKSTIMSSSDDLKNVPLVFVIEKLSNSKNEWVTLGKTVFGLQIINVAYASDSYKWRITAVDSRGVVDEMSTHSYTTLNGYVEPGPPTNIRVARNRTNTNSVDVLIAWDPPDERSCFYKGLLVDTNFEENRPFRIRDEPLGVHQYWFENLRFGTNYAVRITTRNPDWKYESAQKTLNFQTPTCLQSHNFRFDMCEPPSPREITTVIDVEAKAGNQSKVSVTLKWKPPMHTSEMNRIEKYVVEITDMGLLARPHLGLIQTSNASLNISAFHPPLTDSTNGNKFRRFEVPGNTTSLRLSRMRPNIEFEVMLTAHSSRGASPPVRYTFVTKLPREDYSNGYSWNNWLYLAIPISFVIVILLTCHFSRVYFHKRRVKKARNHYFQSMDERDGMSADWSIVPLTEEVSSWKLFDENFPKEKWEILYKDLIMGDVIGQGAFGIVRRAGISHNKLISMKHKREGGTTVVTNNNGPPISDRRLDHPYVNAPGFSSDVEMDTVAVKMLKVSATQDDRDQLIKEITTMQSLGCHPQIVGLLGACTRGRTLCLVLEFCPGGDLLSFLRKVRSKYWPTLGLSEGRKSNSASSIKITGIMRNSIITSEEQKNSDSSSPINYADIGGFTEYLSSPDKCPNEDGTTPQASTDLCNVSKQPPVNSNDLFDFDDDCRPIDEKDVISYARQISMGMEYLEKNHVVHRDLATRNVLLLGDYKQVKLSDFGLSRDIYTWNVYHQKSNGKLPIKWMSIESIFTHVFTTKSDVWSFGILLWELVTLGGTPYPGLGNTELFHLLKSGYRMERPDNCSEELYALMKKCWRTSPVSRPNFTELRRHLETMLEAAEPNLYLSLMADIPSDYFHLCSRSDLLPDESLTPTNETSAGCSTSRRVSRGRSSYLITPGQNSIRMNSKGNPEERNEASKDYEMSNCISPSHRGLKANALSSTSMDSSGSSVSKRLSLDLHNQSFPSRKNSSSPDSGIQPGSSFMQDQCDTETTSFLSHENEIKSKKTLGERKRSAQKYNMRISKSCPIKCINNMTIIENRSYDLTP